MTYEFAADGVSYANMEEALAAKEIALAQIEAEFGNFYNQI